MTASSGKKGKPKIIQGRMLIIVALLAIAGGCFIMAVISHFTAPSSLGIWIGAMTGVIGSCVAYATFRAATT